MTQGTFDLWQQTFTLSMMANGDFGVNQSTTTGGLAKNLESSITGRFANPDLQKLIGDSWKLAWGPCVFQKKNSTYADNAMFVAHDPVNHIYVVAIAATNPDSAFDIVQDFNITPIPWPYGGSAPHETIIAQGTSVGVNALLDMQSQGQTLLSYLQNRAGASSSTLIFTGHSLGGALSPTLALALTEQGLKLRDWKAVNVYPTAGPTAGNALFKRYFSQAFPQSATGPQPWQVWNADVVNRLDVVPCAWDAQTLPSIPNLYAPKITVGFLVKALMIPVDLVASSLGYTRIGTANLTGSSVQGSGNTVGVFQTEARYQHVNAYLGLLGVEALQPIFNFRNPYAPTPPVMVSASAG